MKKEFNKNIPNYLTIARLVLSVIVIIFLLMKSLFWIRIIS